tara:strand:+ start:2729 stop:4672 length:1944 start_codon:yes stop_codon:yes gene_type:complete
METLFQDMVYAGESILYFAWLPLTIWTLASCAGWLLLRTYTTLHPQIQYHGRLALMFALPAGFLALIILQGIEFIFNIGAAETINLKIITVLAPMEVTINSVEQASIYSFNNMLLVSLFLLLVLGVIYSLFQFVSQWIYLKKIKSTYHFTSLSDMEGLDSGNIELADSIQKQIGIAFSDDDIIPSTFGYINPVILLPKSLQTNSEKLNLAIRHELTHISQNDFLSQVTTICTGIFFWFHPIVHLLKRELIEFRELRCDSMVLSEQNISRKEYASLLLELLHMPNFDKELSVNMAQESSNLKKRIQMITKPNIHKPIPKRLSFTLFGVIIISTAIFMACTDMQTSEIFDNEELNLMTDVDQDGSRGYHQVLIFMGDEEQAERHMEALDQLNAVEENHILSINVLKGERAIEKYGERGTQGVIEVNTHISEEAYNSVLTTLGMEKQDLDLYNPDEEKDFFVVVEKMPELIGGLESLASQIQYPEMARRAGIEGRVFVQFIVNEEGEVEHPRIIRGIGGGADEEALRVVRQAKFTPGVQRGKPVRVQYALPFNFKLPESETTSETSTIDNPTVIERNMAVQIDPSENGINGRILDVDTKQPLVGANVIIDGSSIGSVTDVNGYFSLSGNQANQSSIVISHIGYETTRLQL